MHMENYLKVEREPKITTQAWIKSRVKEPNEIMTRTVSCWGRAKLSKAKGETREPLFDMSNEL
jgi:hypothetical protein